MKILCIGSAVIDITAQPVSIETAWKEKQRISSIQIQVGGDAANQSLHLADLGCEVQLVSCIGADANGELLRSELTRRGVDTSLLQVKEKEMTGTAVVLVDEKGERHIFSVKGAYSTLDKYDIMDIRLDEYGAVSLASIFSMPELEQDGLLEFLKRTREKRILTFADLAADKLHQGLAGIAPFLSYLDYFLPSFYDVQEMADAETPEEAAAFFRRQGVDHVVIKCGERGCFCMDSTTSGWINAAAVAAVDTTGAGDCMVSVMAARILEGDSMMEACRYACTAASLSTLYMGASREVLTDERIREAYHEFYPSPDRNAETQGYPEDE